jgi:hypothetical protein
MIQLEQCSAPFRAGYEQAMSDHVSSTPEDIAKAIGTYANAPASTDYERGYLAGLRAVGLLRHA